MALQKINIISIPVSDQQRAKEFYLKFGFTLVVENKMGPDQTWIQLGIPGTETTITLVNWFPDMPVGSVRGLVITTDDIDKEIERLKTEDIEVGQIDKTPWGRFATVKDPDGNALSLHQ